MRKFFFLLLLMLPAMGFSQEIIVKSFKEGSATSLSKTIGDIPKTNEGEDAAVIVVKTPFEGLSFEGRILTDEQHPAPAYSKGEYVVYVAPRSKTLTIKSPGFKDEKINVADYSRTIPDGLQSRRTYDLYLQVTPKSVVSGRNLSFGFNGGYLMPMISSSADGYNGSPINYGNGTALEDADYTGAEGFVVGVNIDFRLHKNFFLNAGINFGQYRYKNSFNGPTIYITDRLYEYHAISKYKESYLNSFLQIPIYFSYRFPTSRRSNLQFGLGPVFNYGISSKMKFNGIDLLNEGDITIGGEIHSISFKGEMGLYSKNADVTETTHFSDKPQYTQNSNYTFDNSPFKRFNIATGVYLGYEIQGIMISVHYQYMLTNMANKGYWENRFSFHNATENYIANAKMAHHFLQFKLGYTLRY